MKQIQRISELRQAVARWKEKGDVVALVPTMGNLHEGHLSLLRKAVEDADRVIVSLFVNPLQFNRQQDLKTYPSTLTSDIKKLQKEGVDCLFNPDVEEVYPIPLDKITRINVTGFIETLEGKYRPNHLQGVATVVQKLFNMAQPDIAVFGEKDRQQLLMIQKMVVDLNAPVKVISGPIIRESDGLAMSSRNNNLSKEDRKKAPAIHRTLKEVAARIADSNKKTSTYPGIEKEAITALEVIGFSVDYLKICDSKTLQPASKESTELSILTAASLKKVRLIDNLTISL